MFLFIVCFLGVLSYLEVSVLIAVGSKFGGVTAVLLTLLTAMVGGALVRSQGMQTALAAREAMSRGETPAQHLCEGLMLVLAGIMLFMPGFITDFVGALLLLPPLRQLGAQKMLERSVVAMNKRQSGFGQAQGSNSQHRGSTFEGEFERRDDDHNRLN